jgi:hypothetical protein
MKNIPEALSGYRLKERAMTILAFFRGEGMTKEVYEYLRKEVN